MTILIDRNGAQILPPVENTRATVTAWVARLTADGDLRTKHPEYAVLAGTLYPVGGAA